MPEVKVALFNTNRVSMQCPLCTTRVVRDRAAFIAHMVAVHSATESTFDTASITLAADVSPWRKYNNCTIHYPFKCYGCGSVFENNTDLAAHLADEHDAGG